MVDHFGGAIGTDDQIIDLDKEDPKLGDDGSSQVKEIDTYISMDLLMGSYYTIYGKLVEDLDNNYTKG